MRRPFTRVETGHVIPRALGGRRGAELLVLWDTFDASSQEALLVMARKLAQSQGDGTKPKTSAPSDSFSLQKSIAEEMAKNGPSIRTCKR
jgi:hypothetical protein